MSGRSSGRAARVLPISRDGPGGAVDGNEGGESRGGLRGQGRPWRRVVFSGRFVQGNGPGGVVPGGGEDLKKRLDSGARRGSHCGMDREVVYSSRFEQVWRLGGAVPGGGGGIEKGVIGVALDGRGREGMTARSRIGAAAPEEPLTAGEEGSIRV